MINYFFILVFLLSIIYGIVSGNISSLDKAIMELPKEGVIVFFNMAVMLIFFEGILEVATKVGLIRIMTRLFNVLLRPLFKTVDDNTLDYISLNLICNFLGVSNAATGAGFKAMEGLVKKDRICSNEIISFLSLNTAGLCLIPQTIVSLRESFKSSNSTSIVFPSFLVCLVVFITVYIINIGILKYEH